MCVVFGTGHQLPKKRGAPASAAKPRPLTRLSSPAPFLSPRSREASRPLFSCPNPHFNPPTHNSAGAPYKWLNKSPLALGIGFLAWTIPAASPAPSFGGGSLFGTFTESIGQELAKFPTGPSLDSPFWLYFTIYHVGLFVSLTLAQIGVQARKQGYFE